MTQEFLSRAELSEALGVSISTINRGDKNGKWPYTAYIRLGNTKKYPATLIRELLEKVPRTGGEDERIDAEPR